MSLFAYLKENLSIADVVAEFVPIRPAGSYLKGSCPFHSEKDASFTVSPDKQIFYCFGCHSSGDVIGFIAKMENLTQLESAHYLINRYNLNIPAPILKEFQSSLSDSENKDTKQRYFQICKAASLWMHKALLAHKEALAYFKNRNLSLQSIKQFTLGYFPSGHGAINSFIKDLNKEGFLLKDILDYGLLMDGQSHPYSPFEERIIFPIKNTLGYYCGFGGRIFRDGDTRPKYYNSKEIDGFEKGKLLFGFDLAKKELHKLGIGFLVEGYMDCIMMAQSGYINTVATLGTACTHDHLKQLSRFIHTLHVVYDGDDAGQKAMLRLTELCWNVNLELRVIVLPQGQDPASLLTDGNNLETFIAQSLDIFSFFITASSDKFASKPLAQKLSTAEKIATLIAKIPSQLKQDLLLQQAAHVTTLPLNSLKALVRTAQAHASDKFQGYKSAEKAPEQPPNDDAPLLEEKIFSVILNGLNEPEGIRVPAELLPYFSQSTQAIMGKLHAFTEKKPEKGDSLRSFFAILSEPERQWATRVSMHYDSNDYQSTFKHLLARFYKLHWQAIIRHIKEEIDKAKRENNNQKVQEVLQHFGQLKKEILQNRGFKS